MAKKKKSYEFDENDVVDGELFGSNKSDIIDLSEYESPQEPEGVTVYAGNGKDEVTGSSFDDIIWGGNGKDTLQGEDGNDEIFGENGKDELLGGDGNDSLWGGNGKDLLQGEDGNDEIFGGNGKDELLGGDGNDSLDGGKGKDELVGGEDEGTFEATIGDDDSVSVDYEAGDDLTGGDSRDCFVYHLGDGVDIIRDFSRQERDRIKLDGIDEEDVVIVQDNGDSIIAFLDDTTPDPDDLAADAAIIVEGVDDIDLDDIFFA